LEVVVDVHPESSLMGVVPHSLLRQVASFLVPSQVDGISHIGTAVYLMGQLLALSQQSPLAQQKVFWQ
jgi:hypothetical protein